MSTGEARYPTFLLYPESISKNREMESKLMDILMAIGPLHDKDKNNVKGQEYKKAHYHVIYVTANPVTTHNIRKRIQKALGDKDIAKVQVVRQSTENIYSYSTHENKGAIAKSKYKYAKKGIKLLSNFDIDRYAILDVEDKEEMLNDAYNTIDDHGLVNIGELRRFVKEHGSDHNLPSMKTINSVSCSHTGLIRLYFDAMYQERKYGQNCVDTHTGETKK